MFYLIVLAALSVPSLAGDLNISCQGVGPDRDIAFRLALNQCRAMAVEQLRNTFNVKTLSVETERSVGFHQEVSADHDITGLVCKLSNMQEKMVDDSTVISAVCRFDTSKVKIVPKTIKPAPDLTEEGKLAEVVDSPEKSISIERKGIVQSRNRHLVLSSVPRCQSILIRGKFPRSVRCEENPVTLVLDRLDEELIVRAQNYKPKRVRINKNRDVVSDTQVLEVYLER